MTNNNSENKKLDKELKFITNKETNGVPDITSSLNKNFDKKEIVEPVFYDTKDDFDKLKEYIEYLYEKQEKRKNVLVKD